MNSVLCTYSYKPIFAPCCIFRTSLYGDKMATIYFLTVIGYNIKIFSGYLLSTLGKSSRFSYDIRRHKQEMTQVSLVK